MKHFVHFFGPDGAGKTTQVRLTVEHYKHQGVKARKYWARSPHTVAYYAWKLCILIGFYRIVENAFGVPTKLPAVNRSAFLKRVWSIVEFAGVLPLIMKAQLYMLRGYTLVAERYLLDTVTTIAYFEDDPNFINSFVSRAILYFMPKNIAFIFLNSDFETIYDRRAKLYNGLPVSNHRLLLERPRFDYGALPPGILEPRYYIDFQRRMYTRIAAVYPALVINTRQNSIEETHMQITDYLNSFAKN